jgi:5'-methylthioadenosine phosphorylase
MSTVAIIAGSGAGELNPFRTWEPTMVETRFGAAEVRRGELGGCNILFAPRHGRGHVTPPHLINYRALISALSEMGAQRIIGTAAVGSLSPNFVPGTAAVLTDFIDFTRRGPFTFFDSGSIEVVHTDFSEPYCPEVSNALLAGAEKAGLEISTPCTYVCTDGPRYETPAEIAMFRTWGADVVGMTNAPEAILSRELGICYGAIAVITNFAAGISPTPLSHAEVLAVMKSIEGGLAATIIAATELIPPDRGCNCGRD